MLPIVAFLSVFVAVISSTDVEDNHHHHNWLVNCPSAFKDESIVLGELRDVTNDEKEMKEFEEIIKWHLPRTDGFTDGEIVDALEHFFWGQKDGLAMELGALDGSSFSRSMTLPYENKLGWKRILVEGDPTYRKLLVDRSPQSFSANAAICEHHTQVHFSRGEYIGGILEFMNEAFMRDYHGGIYKKMVPPGNVSSITDWSAFPSVMLIDCIPLSVILHKARARHVNYFILDVEGGELQVLKSINWSLVKFDVLCVETEPDNRPPNYPQDVTNYLAEHGYRNATGQQGRNMWFVHKDFVPKAKPHMDPYCFNGARKGYHADQHWVHKGKWPKYELCPPIKDQKP